MILLHPVAAMRILDQHGQRRVGGEITPEIFPIPVLAPSRALPNQPANVAGTLPIHSPAAQREKLRPPPALGPLTPRDGLPALKRLCRQRFIGPEPRASLSPAEHHTEIGPHRHHMALLSLLH